MPILTLKHELLLDRISKTNLSRSDKLHCDYPSVSQLRRWTEAEKTQNLWPDFSGTQSKQVKCDLAGLFVILAKSSLTLTSSLRIKQVQK